VAQGPLPFDLLEQSENEEFLSAARKR
jgi:antitoxin component of RelBE/YafQ-DinJ toxin-antitoxin module